MADCSLAKGMLAIASQNQRRKWWLISAVEVDSGAFQRDDWSRTKKGEKSFQWRRANLEPDTDTLNSMIYSEKFKSLGIVDIVTLKKGKIRKDKEQVVFSSLWNKCNSNSQVHEIKGVMHVCIPLTVHQHFTGKFAYYFVSHQSF